jgi:putative transposase
MMYPLVRELAADGIPVTVTCRVLKIARQPYYRWLACRSPTPSSRRPTARTRCSTPTATTPSSATATCSTNGWWSVFGKPKRGKAGPGPPVHGDLCTAVDDKGRVRHKFSVEGPNELWLTDITEHKTGEGKLYLCAVKDVYSNRIVGYSIDSRMKSRLAVAALNNAVAMRGHVAGWVVHSTG